MLLEANVICTAETRHAHSFTLPQMQNIMQNRYDAHRRDRPTQGGGVTVCSKTHMGVVQHEAVPTTLGEVHMSALMVHTYYVPIIPDRA